MSFKIYACLALLLLAANTLKISHHDGPGVGPRPPGPPRDEGSMEGPMMAEESMEETMEAEEGMGLYFYF